MRRLIATALLASLAACNDTMLDKTRYQGNLPGYSYTELMVYKRQGLTVSVEIRSESFSSKTLEMDDGNPYDGLTLDRARVIGDKTYFYPGNPEFTKIQKITDTALAACGNALKKVE